MTETESTSPLDWFVDSFLQSTGQMMLIVDHMSRYPSDDSAEPFDETLRRLVAGVLEAEFQRRDPQEFAAAAALLATARELIGEEIFLVEPEPPANGGRSRPRRGPH
jgi:hypothetical protein